MTPIDDEGNDIRARPEPEGFVNRFELQIVATLDVVPAAPDPQTDDEERQ